MPAAKKTTKRKAKKKTTTTGPRSLTRVMGLFDILASEPSGLSLAELSGRLKSPKSSMLNLFRPLVTDGFLTHEHGVYKLGPGIFRLSAKVMSVWNFDGIIHQYLETVSRLSGESVYLGVADEELGLITYVDAIDSLQSVRYSIAVGTSRPLYCTAGGQVLLSFGDPSWVQPYLKEVKLERRTKATLTNRRELRKRLAKVQEDGVAVCLGELFDEAGGIAAPVFGADGGLAAVLGIGAPTERLRPKASELAGIIKEVAQKASGMR